MGCRSSATDAHAVFKCLRGGGRFMVSSTTSIPCLIAVQASPNRGKLDPNGPTALPMHETKSKGRAEPLAHSPAYNRRRSSDGRHGNLLGGPEFKQGDAPHVSTACEIVQLCHRHVRHFHPHQHAQDLCGVLLRGQPGGDEGSIPPPAAHLHLP